MGELFEEKKVASDREFRFATFAPFFSWKTFEKVFHTFQNFKKFLKGISYLLVLSPYLLTGSRLFLCMTASNVLPQAAGPTSLPLHELTMPSGYKD